MTDPNSINDNSSSNSSGPDSLFIVGLGNASILGVAAAIGVAPLNPAGWKVVFAFFLPISLFLLAWGFIFFLSAFIEWRGRTAQTSREDTLTVPVVDTCPGEMLPYRLERAGPAPGCMFGFSLGITIICNGIVSAGVFDLIKKWNIGVFQWSRALFFIPFVIIGLILIRSVLYFGLKWLTALLVGRLSVELSAHPLAPANTFHLHIAQKGLFSLARVSLWLVCTEEAQFVGSRGKVRAANQEIAKHSISIPNQMLDGDGLPITVEFRVPDGVMHSFTAPNNQINWTIRVEGVVLGFLSFMTDYRVSVVPVAVE